MTDHAHVADLASLPTVEVLGPTLGFISSLDGVGEDAPCVMRGEIPPGVAIPLHSHADPETFVMLSGTVEALAGGEWAPIAAGDVFHSPGDARHAFHNRSDDPAVMIIATTTRMGRFFREVAQLIGEAGPEDALWAFAEAAERHGHWLAGPEENAAIGLGVAAS